MMVALALSLSAAALTTPAVAHEKRNAGGNGVTRFTAELDPLNGSDADGIATVMVKDGHLHAKVRVHGVAPLLPHAQHIHYGQQARNECPSLAQDDANDDGRLSTTEGQPAYGPIVVSLTTEGDTSPASALAVTRFPVANKQGFYNYNRNGIMASADLVGDIRDEETVVVVHGIDYNGNGMYDFASAGASELDPSLPAEATDPVLCGVLESR